MLGRMVVTAYRIVPTTRIPSIKKGEHRIYRVQEFEKATKTGTGTGRCEATLEGS
jgi:hypothetical protein